MKAVIGGNHFNGTELYAATESGLMFEKCVNNFKFINFEKLKISFDGHTSPLEFLTRLSKLF